jgi:ABC-type polysaccharide/polyol phosphate transport system ATPase subunit
MSTALKIENLNKTFPEARRPLTLFQALKRKIFENGRNGKNFFALSEINLCIEKGEKIGIVGNNGAGKTTLLKMISGLSRPTTGSISSEGSIVFLAGLGIGMIEELSVRENIFLYGTIYGVEREKIQQEFAEIIHWAELEHFVEAKLRTLSLGMKSRLAFSIARHIPGDIFLWDEALSAGDRNFQIKCEVFFKKAKEKDHTFIIASHNLTFIEKFCHKALWLQKGRQIAFGDTAEVLNQYRASTSAAGQR